jgi:putative peptidoglycan lipid II flippase
MFATAALVALGPQLTAAMFLGTPRATTDQYALVATAMMLGVVPYSAQYLFQRVSYAFEDARTPFWIGAVGTALWTAAALLAPSVLAPRWVVVGVGLAMSVANVLTAALWIPVLRRRLGSIDAARLLRTHVRLLAAAAASAALGILVREGTAVYLSGGRLDDYVVLTVAGGLMTLTYVLMLRVLRVDELDTLIEPVRARLRRRAS